MARINREHELLVQERSTAAAKNAAVIAFLQQLSGQHQNSTKQAGANFPQPLPQAPLLMSNNNAIEIQKINNGHSVVAATATPPTTTVVAATPTTTVVAATPTTIVVAATSTAITTPPPPPPSSLSSLSSSRWPKAEVHALIKIRTSLETKYQENGPKAPLWEDISAGMLRLGYNRSAKRCKEKWENINKYFKKVKESNRQRREDSKTCPYFHELEALYKEKSKNNQNLFGASFHNMKPHEMMEPLMVQPEQQWRPPSQYEAKENNEESQYERKDHRDEDEEEEEEEDENENEEGDLESVEDEGGSRYEIATNKLSSVDSVE